jgi:hypothetical protein
MGGLAQMDYRDAEDSRTLRALTGELELPEAVGKVPGTLQEHLVGTGHGWTESAPIHV